MAARLSELLERIRPSGTPGASAGAARPTGRQLDAAFDQIAAALQEFRAEAGVITVQALDRSDALADAAEQEIARLRADLPDRLAEAGSLCRPVDDDPELAELDATAEREIERLDAAADARIDRLVHAAIGTIWSLLDDTPPATGPEAPR